MHIVKSIHRQASFLFNGHIFAVIMLRCWWTEMRTYYDCTLFGRKLIVSQLWGLYKNIMHDYEEIGGLVQISNMHSRIFPIRVHETLELTCLRAVPWLISPCYLPHISHSSNHLGMRGVRKCYIICVSFCIWSIKANVGRTRAESSRVLRRAT